MLVLDNKIEVLINETFCGEKPVHEFAELIRRSLSEEKNYYSAIKNFCKIKTKETAYALIDINETTENWLTTNENNTLTQTESDLSGTLFEQATDLLLEWFETPTVKMLRNLLETYHLLSELYCDRHLQNVYNYSFDKKKVVKKTAGFGESFSSGIALTNPYNRTRELFYIAKDNGEYETKVMNLTDLSVESKSANFLKEETTSELTPLIDRNRDCYIWPEPFKPCIRDGLLYQNDVVFGSLTIRPIPFDGLFIEPEKIIADAYVELYIAEIGGPFQQVENLSDYNFKPCTKYEIKTVSIPSMNEEIFYYYSLCLPFTSFLLENKTSQVIEGGVIEVEFLEEDFYAHHMETVFNPDKLVFTANGNKQLKYDVISYSKRNEYTAFLLFLETINEELLYIPPYGVMTVDVTHYPD